MLALLTVLTCSFTVAGVAADLALDGCRAEDGECPGDGDDTTSLLQMHLDFRREPAERLAEGLNDSEVVQPASAQPTGVLDTCPPDKFNSSLAWLLEKKLMAESNATMQAMSQYIDLAAQYQCGPLPQKWYTSQKPLIVNVGEGTTATRWVHAVMLRLGFRSLHYNKLVGTKEEDFGTEKVDKFDFLSDVPMPMMTWEFLQSHPNAVFIMTVREPAEWQASRLDHYNFTDPEATGGKQAVPCGRATFRVDDAASIPSYVAYSAWAKCVLPADRLLAANLFVGDPLETDKAFFDELVAFLEKHGLQKENDWNIRKEKVRAELGNVGGSDMESMRTKPF